VTDLGPDRILALPASQRRALRTQALAGWLAFGAIGPLAVAFMRGVRANRVEGIEQARRVYRGALATGRPVVVAANHLTLTDSFYLHHGLDSLAAYMMDFRRLSWNVAAVENFGRHPIVRTITYLGKTLLIDRAGDPEHHKQVLDTITYLVARGEVCTLFPEGGRSRSGRVETDQVTYGIGRVLSRLHRPIVVCAYLRGERQVTWSAFPARGDTLHLRAEALEPKVGEPDNPGRSTGPSAASSHGLRASRDLARQVIEKLKSMENEHFHHWGPAK
jgi:1-acyl-sn-glycerol-3-phosphate acyltransferase